MSKITEGAVTIDIPDSIEIPDKAGKLKYEEVLRITKVRRGIGQACAAGASELTKKSGQLFVPGVDPSELARFGAMSEEIDIVIEDVKVILVKLKQANLLIDAKAFDLLSRVNDQVKVQSKHDPSLRKRFNTVLEYFRKRRGAREKPPEKQPKKL